MKSLNGMQGKCKSRWLAFIVGLAVPGIGAADQAHQHQHQQPPQLQQRQAQPQPQDICIGPLCIPDICILIICLPPIDEVLEALLPGLPIFPSDPLPPTPPPPVPPTKPPGCDDATIKLKVLVISADGNEPSLAAIRDALDYHSVPHTVWIATQNPGQLTPAVLASGACDGNYQGVILATGGLAYSPDGGATFVSALSNTEWLDLRTYEAKFGVREIAWYVFPNADQGLNTPSAGFDTTTSPLNGTLTADGAAVFTAVKTTNPIPIRNVWAYLTTPSDPGVKPLLVDSAGNSLVSMRTTTDGREQLSMTFDSNPSVLHDVVLAHGLVEWLTKGTYVGEYRVYMNPQADDMFLGTTMYYGGELRIAPADLNAWHAWQNTFKTTRGNPDFRLAFAYNSAGTGSSDPLTQRMNALQASYHFISHTVTHTNMDQMSYADARTEVRDNDTWARNRNYTRYSTLNLVTPQVSGLNNLNAMRAAADMGVRYTVSDTSRPEWNNPRPNVGIRSTIEPRIFHLPRKPTNLFFNVATPNEWRDEYNSIYRSFWGRDLTYAEILDKESEFLLFYLLRGDLDPQMYHVANLKAYDGTRSLLSDLLDAAWNKYTRYYKLPIMSPDMQVAAKRMENTTNRIASGLVATLTRNSVVFTSPVAVQFAVSGVCTAQSEQYAGKCITTVNVPANGIVTIPF